MTQINATTCATNLDDNETNAALFGSGHTIRHIETWHAHASDSVIVWDAPEISQAELPF